MSVNKSMKRNMAIRYEAAWNEVVSGLSNWKKEIIINNFEIIDGKHIYHSKDDQRIINEVAHEAAKLAESSAPLTGIK